MSVSLVHDGGLWGLILFHHRSPRFAPFTVRATCELLGEVVAPLLVQQERDLGRVQQRERCEALDAALGRLVRSQFSEEVVDEVMGVLCQAFQAAGVSLQRSEAEFRFGRTPTEAVRTELLQAVYHQSADRTFVTEDLSGFVRDHDLVGGRGAQMTSPALS